MSMTPEQMAAAMLELDLDSSDEDEETNPPPAPAPPGETKFQPGQIKMPGQESGRTGLKIPSVDTNFFAYKVDAKGDPTSEKFDMQKDFFNQPGNGDIQNAPDNLACKKSPQITPNMLGALKDRDYTHVSRTQFQTLPMILEHFDPTKPHDQQTTGDHCVVQGPAGTGKTMAFIVGSVAQIDPNLKKPQVIVISNTTDLAEQNIQQCDLLCWDSTPAKGGEVLYNYVDCSCKKDIPNEQHTCKKIRRSRLSDAATETTVEIETWKLVGGTPVPWKKQIADQNGRLKSDFSAQFISMSEGVLKGLLEKNKQGKFTQLAQDFLEHVRVVVVDEADSIWVRGGIKGLEENYLTPICLARNIGKKTQGKANKAKLSKTQFIFVSATFRVADRAPMRAACNKLEKNGYGNKLYEVYLDNKDLLLNKVKQFRLKCLNYDNQYEALFNICNSISETSKRVLIIPFGEEKEANGKQIGKNNEMDRIHAFLVQKGLAKVNSFGGTRKATDAEKNDKSIRLKKGRIKVNDEDRKKKMSEFKGGDIKYMVATTMDKGINIIECTHVILFGMETKAYDDAKLENDYLQRIGRCGREGKAGCSIVLWNRDAEVATINSVESILNMKASDHPTTKQGIKEATSWNGAADTLEDMKETWEEEFGVERK